MMDDGVELFTDSDCCQMGILLLEVFDGLAYLYGLCFKIFWRFY